MSTAYDVIPETTMGQVIVRLPVALSHSLPARGMVMAQGSLGHQAFVLPLEPDGKGGHFMLVPPQLAEKARLRPGLPTTLHLSPTKDWPEPVLPQDMAQALLENNVLDVYESLTVKARWEWLRWTRSTQNPATRQKRIGVMLDKLRKGDRRPCCFNTAACTLPELSKSGVLLPPET